MTGLTEGQKLSLHYSAVSAVIGCAMRELTDPELKQMFLEWTLEDVEHYVDEMSDAE